MGAVMSEAEAEVEQSHLVLSPHPLQRVGAFALVALAAREDFGQFRPEDFAKAMGQVLADSLRASLRESKAADGFWQKVSLSFFPNAPMNHPGRRKGKGPSGEPKTDKDVQDAVRSWLRIPDSGSWPHAGCALCGRAAVGFYGKRDMALAESEAYRNTTPRGHDGTALCWPCLCSFYALPYGCQLTGGSSIALHSWDDSFLASSVRRRVNRNLRFSLAGTAPKPGGRVKEVVALRALRSYGERLTDGVELLVFNNNNRGQLLEKHRLDQPLAEWLRRTCRFGDVRVAFTALVRAHASSTTPGVVSLARNAFRDPERIVGRGVGFLAGSLLGPEPDHAELVDVAKLIFSFADEVLLMNEKDRSEIQATAKKLAAVLYPETSRGRLREFRAQLRNSRQLRSWLLSRDVVFVGREDAPFEGPLVSEHVMVLLFDPSQDNPSWFHRDLLLVGVVEELARLGWTAKDESEKPDDEVEKLRADDKKWINSDDDDEENER